MSFISTLAQAVDSATVMKAVDSATTSATSGTPPPNNEWMTLLIWVAAFIAIIYFMILRPQKKQQQERKNLLASIKAGDRVMTTSGIFGTIVKVNEQTYVVKISDSTQVEMLHAAVAEVIPEKKESTHE